MKLINNNKKILPIFIIIILLITISLIYQITINKSNNISYHILTIILITLPLVIEYKYKLVIPLFLKIILFIFPILSMILGEVYHFYTTYPYFDKFLHLLNGFISSSLGYSILYNLNKRNNKILILLFTITFSISLSSIWEILEYTQDNIFLKDCQNDTTIYHISSLYFDKEEPYIIDNIDYTIIGYKDLFNEPKEITIKGYLDIGLNDTMQDLIIGIIGSIIFTLLLYLYLINKTKYPYINNFIIKRY